MQVPAFNSDSAYFFVTKQVAFGPRIPNTKAHALAGDYFIRSFERFGAKVFIQEFESPTFDGQNLQLRNIIASFILKNKSGFFWRLIGIQDLLPTKIKTGLIQPFKAPMMGPAAWVFVSK